MPKEELYAPPLNIRVRDNRQFGRKPLVGIYVIKSLEPFRCNPLPLDSEDDEITPLPNGQFKNIFHCRGLCCVRNLALQPLVPALSPHLLAFNYWLALNCTINTLLWRDPDNYMFEIYSEILVLTYPWTFGQCRLFDLTDL